MAALQEVKKIKRKEIKELYYIRAIAAMGILIIHGSAGFVTRSVAGSNAMFLGIFVNQFFRFGSPIFMMVSGLVIFYNYRSIEEFDIKRFYKKKIKFILVPYILWSIIYFTYTSYTNSIPLTGARIMELGRGILFGETFSHLYFIFLIFQFYIILPLLIKYLAKPMEEKPFRVFSFFFVFQATILIYGYYFKNLAATGLVRFFNKYYWKTVFGWSFYFIAGGILGMHYDSIVNFIEKHIKPIFLVYIITSIGYLGHVYYSIWIQGGRDGYGKFGSIRPHTMVYALFTMAILIWITRRLVGKCNWLKNFGSYSFGIYFAHPLILVELNKKLMGWFPNHIGFSRVSSLILVCGLGLVLTFALVLLIGMFKNRWVLIGRVPRYRLGSLRKGE